MDVGRSASHWGGVLVAHLVQRPAELAERWPVGDIQEICVETVGLSCLSGPVLVQLI